MTYDSLNFDGTSETDGNDLLRKLSDRADKIIDRQWEKVGVKDFEFDPESVKAIMNPSSEYLTALSSEACFENAFRLTSYRHFLEKLLNAELARIELYQHFVNHIYAKYWKVADQFAPPEIKYHQIQENQPYLKPIVSEINRMEAHQNTCKTLCGSLNQYIRLYDEKGKSKRWNK